MTSTVCVSAGAHAAIAADATATRMQTHAWPRAEAGLTVDRHAVVILGTRVHDVEPPHAASTIARGVCLGSIREQECEQRDMLLHLGAGRSTVFGHGARNAAASSGRTAEDDDEERRSAKRGNLR